RAVGIGLAVAHQNLDRTRTTGEAQPLAEGFPDAAHHEIIGLAEPRERSRLRAHVADLDRAALRARDGGNEAGDTGGERRARRQPHEPPPTDPRLVPHAIL